MRLPGYLYRPQDARFAGRRPRPETSGGPCAGENGGRTRPALHPTGEVGIREVGPLPGLTAGVGGWGLGVGWVSRCWVLDVGDRSFPFILHPSPGGAEPRSRIAPL